MKNKYFLIIFALSISCVRQPDNLFDTTPQQRVDNLISETKSALQDGMTWVMEYYPHENQIYGGFLLGFRFNSDGTVKIANELDKVWRRSQYEFGGDVGATLNFVTSNPSLNYFTTGDTNQGEGLGWGFAGDYEFKIADVADGAVRLQGKKTGNHLKLFRIDGSFEDYCAKSEARLSVALKIDILEEKRQDAIVGTHTGRKLLLYPERNGSRNLLYAYEGENEIRRMAYTISPSGISFYSDIDGIDRLDCPDPESGKFTANTGEPFEIREDPEYKQYLGNYIFRYKYDSKDLTKINEIPVRLAQGPGFTYYVDGLPFRYRLKFNSSHDRVELGYQQIFDDAGKVIHLLFLSGLPDEDNVIINRQIVMYGKLADFAPGNTLEFSGHNSPDDTFPKSFLIYSRDSSGNEYVADEYGEKHGYYINPKLIKK